MGEYWEFRELELFGYLEKARSLPASEDRT